MHAVVIQDRSEPPLQEIHPCGRPVHILRVPPLFEKSIDLIHVRTLVYERVVILVDGSCVAAAHESGFFQGD